MQQNKHFEFKLAKLEDIPALVDYRIRFAIELSGPQPEKSIQALQIQLNHYFEQAISNNTCISYIGMYHTEVVGIGSMVIRAMPGNFKNPSGKWGYIMNMYTSPAFRKMGVANNILLMLMDKGKEYGVTAFELHATTLGQPVYSKCGFNIHAEPTMRKFI